MSTFLLNLFGVHIDQAAHLAKWSVSPRGTIPWYWLAAAAAVLGATVYWMYSRSGDHVSRGRRVLLASLRTLFLAALLGLLARPVLRVTVEGSVRRALLLLVDVSDSMNQQDKRIETPDVKRAALGMGLIDPAKGLDQPLDASAAAPLKVDQVARLDLVKAVLKNQKLALMDRLSQEYDVRPYTFGRSLRPVALPAETRTGEEGNGDTEMAVAARKAAVATWVSSLKAGEPSTALGDAVRDALSQTRGQPLAGVWVVTDGQSNVGSAVTLAADAAKQAGVPVYAYGVGITTPKDVVVASVFAPDVCFVDDEAPVTVRVRNTGEGGQAAHLDLKLSGPAGGAGATENGGAAENGASGKVIDGADVTFDPTGEQVVAVKFKPDKPGEYDLTARIEPRPEEANKDNNQFTHHVRVIDGKIKLLYVEQSPRWEFKYLLAMLARDRRVEMKCVLLEGDPGIALGEKTPYLSEFPAKKEDLFKYDLVILGDVDPKAIPVERMNDLQEFVSKFGGGLLTIAGRRSMPWGYAGTPIDDMLPVDVEEERSVRQPGKPFEPAAEAGDQPIRLELTPAGRESPLLKLSDKPEESEALWRKLPPIFWDARVARAKEGSDVLMVDPTPAKETRDGKMPVVALHAYGIGQVLFVGTDNTWRWRKNVGDRYYVALWGQIVQRLSLPHLLGSSKKTQLSADKLAYTTGDAVTVYARLYDDAFKPIDRPSVEGFAVVEGQAPVPVPLRPVAGGKGVYGATFPAGRPGNWSFYVESDLAAKVNFSVSEPVLEQSETALNEAGLKELAATTGGQFFREEDLHALPDSVRLKNERVQSTFETELCFTWVYFLLLVLIVTGEWVLRKVCQLK